MAHPSPSDWKKHESVARAGTSGWNPLVNLPTILREEYPWMQDFEFAFIHETELPEAESVGWKFLRPDHFDIDNFNEAIGLGAGLRIKDGAIWSGQMIIMIMPKYFREIVEEARFKSHEERHAAQTEGRRFVHSEDPHGQEYLASDEVVSDLEESTVRTGKAEEKKRGPGRPRKN